jgi:pyrroloquinoline-quinone synthase
MDLAHRLIAAIAPHDLLQHPFYVAWSRGELTLSDLRLYAAQYRHQVEALPALLSAAVAQTGDAETRAALERNLAEEGGHCELWLQFAEAVGGTRATVAPDAKTVESGSALRALVAEGPREALGALWAYEHQTARVATTKREGLQRCYGVDEVAFFETHEGLDVHHARDLIDGLERVCASEADVEAACGAAARSAQAQWLFLDGVEAFRRS